MGYNENYIYLEQKTCPEKWGNNGESTPWYNMQPSEAYKHVILAKRKNQQYKWNEEKIIKVVRKLKSHVTSIVYRQCLMKREKSGRQSFSLLLGKDR